MERWMFIAVPGARFTGWGWTGLAATVVGNIPRSVDRVGSAMARFGRFLRKWIIALRFANG